MQSIPNIAGACVRADTDVITDSKECFSGPCCDPSSNDFLPLSEICSVSYGEEKCSKEYVCGGSARLEWEITQYCSGESARCDGATEEEWITLEECGEYEFCEEDLFDEKVGILSYCEGIFESIFACECFAEDSIYPPNSGTCWKDYWGGYLTSWTEAFNHCENLEASGHTDWRLPSIQEIGKVLGNCDSSVENGASGFCDPCTYLNNCSGYFQLSDEKYWSSTPGADNYAMYADFETGEISSDLISSEHIFRCVRTEPL